MSDQHKVNTQKDGLDNFWKIAQHYGVSFQELKQINKGKGAENGNYAYEQRDPPYGLSDGDTVLLPPPQLPDKKYGDAVSRCPAVEIEKNWLKIKARYNDKWKTVLPYPNVKIAINDAVVESGVELKPGIGNNTRSDTLKHAIATKNEPAVHVIEDVFKGDVVARFVNNSDLEKSITETRHSLQMVLDSSYRDLVVKMEVFQKQWDKHLLYSIYISGSQGILAGAATWGKDQLEYFDLDTWKEMYDTLGDAAGKAFDYAADYAEDTYKTILKSANDLSEWIEDNEDYLLNWNWWSEKIEKSAEQAYDSVEQHVRDSIDFLESSRDTVTKIFKHRKAILESPRFIAEGNVDKIEDFIDTVLMDIDPEYAQKIKDNPNFHIVLELIIDHDTALTYFAYLSLFLEAVPPNFYAYMAGRGGGYLALEIILCAVLAYLSAGIAAEARIATLCARVGALSARLACKAKKIRKLQKSQKAVESFVRTIEDFNDCLDSLFDLGKELHLNRNRDRVIKGRTNRTLADEKELNKRNTRCRICGSTSHGTQRSRNRGCVEYE